MAIDLFEPSMLGGVALRNRFVRSATWEGMAGDDGSCGEKLADVVSELAEGEVVLIKMSSEDFIDGGLTVEDMIQTAKMLEQAGLDGIELRVQGVAETQSPEGTALSQPGVE